MSCEDPGLDIEPLSPDYIGELLAIEEANAEDFAQATTAGDPDEE